MKLIICWVTFLVGSCATASDTITAEPNGNSYNYVSQYTVEIAASANSVWGHLINIPSWMYELEISFSIWHAK